MTEREEKQKLMYSILTDLIHLHPQEPREWWGALNKVFSEFDGEEIRDMLLLEHKEMEDAIEMIQAGMLMGRM